MEQLYGKSKHVTFAWLTKQIGMRPRVHQREDQHISVNAIDQKPIGFNMAFAAFGIVPREPMIRILFGQFFAATKHFNNFTKERYVQSSFFTRL